MTQEYISGKNIRYGQPLYGDEPTSTFMRMAQPLIDPVRSWEHAKPEDIERLRGLAIENGTPEDRLSPGFHKRVLEITGSDEGRDRYNSRILIDGTWKGKKYGKGWKLDNYRRNPVFMPLHDYDDVPVGQSLHTYTDSIGRDDSLRRRLRFIILFTSREENPLGDTMHRLYKGGFMRASSVGWWPEKFMRITDEEEIDNFDLDKEHRFSPMIFATSELWELSAVPIPGNPNALVEDSFTAEEIGSFRMAADQAAEVAPSFAGQIQEYLKTVKTAMEEIASETSEEPEEGIEIEVEVKEPEGEEVVEEDLMSSEPYNLDELRSQLDGESAEFRQAFQIQSLLFPKDKGWDVARSVKWAKDHEFRADKVDENDNTVRLRQHPPGDFEKGSFKTLCLSPGGTKPGDEKCRIKAVGGRMKEGRDALVPGTIESLESRIEDLESVVEAMGETVITMTESLTQINETLTDVLSAQTPAPPNEEDGVDGEGGSTGANGSDGENQNPDLYEKVLDISSEITTKLRS